MTLMDPARKGISRRDYVLFGSVWFIIISIVFFLYKAFVPETVLTVSVNPLPMVAQWEVETSRAIMYRMHYCKSVESPSTVVRELRSVNSPMVVSLYTTGYSLPLGCDVVDIVEPMPLYIPKGTYTLRITFTYRVNAITSPYTFETEPFTLQ